MLLSFRETKAPGRDTGLPREASRASTRSSATHGLRRFYGVNFLLYLAIFGFLLLSHVPGGRVPPGRLWVSESHRLGRRLPIVLANLWLTGFLSARITIKTLTLCSAALTGLFIVADTLARGTQPPCGRCCF